MPLCSKEKQNARFVQAGAEEQMLCQPKGHCWVHAQGGCASCERCRGGQGAAGEGGQPAERAAAAAGAVPAPAAWNCRRLGGSDLYLPLKRETWIGRNEALEWLGHIVRAEEPNVISNSLAWEP